jgi:sodium transport system permease protein
MVLLVQIGLILLPCLLLAILLTKNPRRALRIHRVQWSHVIAAVLIGFSLHPTYQVLGGAIVQVYPISPEAMKAIAQFQATLLQQDLWWILLLVAVLPAICEELAFRGFIFGGLLRQQGIVRALVVSSILFGLTHAVLQQSISACVMGLVLGLIAWRTGGVLCTILVHMINNGLTLTLAWCGNRSLEVPDLLRGIIVAGQDSWSYQTGWHSTSVVLSIALLLILFQRSRRTERSVLAEMA